MKKLVRMIAAISAILVIGLALQGCAWIASIFGEQFAVERFYEQSKNTLPQFGITTPRGLLTAAVSSRSGGGADSRIASDFYNTLMETMPGKLGTLFYFLMSWESPDGVDRSNLYRLLYDVQTLSAKGYSSMTPKAIIMPFAKITTDVLYTHGYTEDLFSGVMKDDGTTLSAAASWMWTEPSVATTYSYGNYVASFNSATSDLAIDFAYSVDYDNSNPAISPMVGDTGRGYSRRTIISGNSSTNFFRVQASAGFVGMGYSRGAGKYMLFKYKDGMSEAGQEIYLVVPAEGADETWFRGRMSAASPGNTDTAASGVYTTAASLPAEVADYKDWVVSTAYLVPDDAELISTDQLTGEGQYKIQIAY